MVCSSLESLQKNGVNIPLEKGKQLIDKITEICREDVNKLEKLVGKIGHIYEEEGTMPLAIVGASPVRKTPLGPEVFRLRHSLEKDMVETVLPRIDPEKRQPIEDKLNDKIAVLVEKEEKAWRSSVFSIFVSALSIERLEPQLCDWVRSEII